MAQRNFKALLFDTRSIQRYIYSGNKLRTNVGASYIVDKVFFDVLIDDVLREMFPDEKFPSDNDAWTLDNDNATPWDEMKSCCVAYVGGGKALLLFKSSSNDLPVEVVRRFTRQLLTKRPGLKVGAAIDAVVFNEDGELDQASLYQKLKDNRNNIFPAVNVPYTGLTLSCEINGEAANFCQREGRDLRFTSQEVAVKSKYAKDANDDLRDRFNQIFKQKGFPDLMGDYNFPLEIEKLGQKEGENYFAIVHVDGNNMGVKFQRCKTLMRQRKLSREIRRKTEGAFADLLAKIILIKRDKLFGDSLALDDYDLPIRPLIIGGDDVTFLCPANMAILFTKTLMENLYADTPLNAPPECLTEEAARHMDTCAGIAILPTKYPFFRGYDLAEQLCDEAKKSMRNLAKDTTEEEKRRGSSWLDFAILHGEQSPTLKQIRAQEYRGAGNKALHFGAYLVCGTGDAPHKLENLLNCTRQFLVSKKENKPPDVMAHNKIKDLRGILQRGEDEARKFLQQLDVQGKRLPHISDWKDFDNTFWYEGATPYIDAIELMDFYVEEVERKWQDWT